MKTVYAEQQKGWLTGNAIESPTEINCPYEEFTTFGTWSAFTDAYHAEEQEKADWENASNSGQLERAPFGPSYRDVLKETEDAT